MLSSLYGNLPPLSSRPTEDRTDEETPSTGGPQSNSVSAAQIGAVGVSHAPPEQTGEEGNATRPSDKATHEKAEVANPSSGAPLSYSAWSSTRARLFVPPTLRSKINTNTTATSEPTAPTQPNTTPSNQRVEPATQDAPASPPTASRAALTPTLPTGELDDVPMSPVETPVRIDPASLYDPSKPNSFDLILKERETRKRQMDIQRREEEELKQLRALRASGPSNLALNVSGEEAWARRARLSASTAGGGNTTDVASEPASPVVAGPVDSGAGGARRKQLALSMMERMGWKSGEGLGREKQGIVVPLVARKMDKKSGVIVQGRAAAGRADHASPGAGVNAPQPGANATRILLLSNLVGRGEVDSDLENETVEEAAKYGNLLSIKVIENEDQSVPDADSVRIFLEYESSQHAFTAMRTFNGRFFGGRIVTGRFYSETAFGEGFFWQNV